MRCSCLLCVTFLPLMQRSIALAAPCDAQSVIVGPIVARPLHYSDERAGSDALSHYRLIGWQLLERAIFVDLKHCL
ncbi:hypothetical protein V8C34DRAFT_274372 [Trichoderma compactum]